MFQSAQQLSWEISILHTASSAFPGVTPAVPKWHSAPISTQFLFLAPFLGFDPLHLKPVGMFPEVTDLPDLVGPGRGILPQVKVK